MAGIKHFEVFQKPALAGLVDETVKDKVPTIGDEYLPDVNAYSSEIAYDIIKTSQYIAPYIGVGAEAPLMDRDAIAKVLRGDAGKMGIKHMITEEEMLKLQEGRRSSQEQGAILDALTVQGVRLIDAVQKRMDITKMLALCTGTFTHNKNGVKIAVDFGVPAEHKVALLPGADWNTEGRDVLGDLIAFADQYEETNGIRPEKMLMSRQTFGKLALNPIVLAEAGRSEGARRASEVEVNAVLEANGLPQATIVGVRSATSKNFEDDGNEVIEFLPENRIVFLSQGVGEYRVTPTVENDYEPGIALIARDEDEPIRSILKAVGAGFPAVMNPYLIFHADVYTP